VIRTVPAGVQVIPREEFIHERFRYDAGEHTTVLGPTGYGKTELCNELLKEIASPELPALMLAAKPRDETMKKWSAHLDSKIVEEWPPKRKLLDRMDKDQPTFYTVWPKHTFDPDVDDAHLYDVFRSALLESYKTGNRIISADELLGLTDIGLRRELVTLWTRGRSMGTGLFGASQKPTDIPTYAYGQAAHLFLANDPDKRSRDRFKEIGGVDPKLVDACVMSLAKFQWLYIRRDGPKMCIVDR
jgi:hypothetical protein